MEIEKADISAVWLDITNAHGAVPCQLIFFAFRHYGLHPDIITLLEAYYNGLWSRYLCTNSPSSWHHYSRGTFKSFTIFILFLSALNVAIEFILADANSLQCFKTLLVWSLSKSKKCWWATNSSCVLKWARMSLKASKSKTLVLANSTVDHETKLKINTSQYRELIPTTCSNPLKLLECAIALDLTHKDQIEKINSAISTLLCLINKSKRHGGVHKFWILQHLLLPCFQWPLLIHEIPISSFRLSVKDFFILKEVALYSWVISNICLYSLIFSCPLFIKKLTSILKSSKRSGQLLLRDS